MSQHAPQTGRRNESQTGVTLKMGPRGGRAKPSPARQGVRLRSPMRTGTKARGSIPTTAAGSSPAGSCLESVGLFDSHCTLPIPLCWITSTSTGLNEDRFLHVKERGDQSLQSLAVGRYICRNITPEIMIQAGTRAFAGCYQPAWIRGNLPQRGLKSRPGERWMPTVNQKV